MAYIKNEVDYKRMKKDIDKLIKEAKTKVVKVKKVQAWAVPEISGELNCVGNGKQWQYPIFLNRANAREYIKECHGLSKKIIEVTISYSLNNKRK